MEIIYAKFEFPENYSMSKNRFILSTEKYILKKLVRIAERYAPYASHLVKKESQIIHSVNPKTIHAYIDDLYEDHSHITYKLKQAIYYLKYQDLVPKEKNFILKLNELYENKEAIRVGGRKEIENVSFIELLPPPIDDINIKLAENDKNDKLTDFKFLSSGEKQQIYAASSILYHLQNLDSVDREDLVTYTNLNFLLDEIELYYHPEMQRTYLAYLLKMLSRIEVRNINSINICMVTHSPYILSDIPNNYLLKLEDGQSSNEKESKTFGANVHDLLANDFFMEKGFMGEYAKNEINKTIEALNFKSLNNQKEEKQNLLNSLKAIAKKDDEKHTMKLENLKNEILEITNQLQVISEPDKKYDENYCRSLISLVGEPMLYMSLMELYALAYKDSKKDFINEQILKLQKMMHDSNSPE